MEHRPRCPRQQVRRLAAAVVAGHLRPLLGGELGDDAAVALGDESSSRFTAVAGLQGVWKKSTRIIHLGVPFGDIQTYGLFGTQLAFKQRNLRGPFARLFSRGASQPHEGSPMVAQGPQVEGWLPVGLGPFFCKHTNYKLEDGLEQSSRRSKTNWPRELTPTSELGAWDSSTVAFSQPGAPSNNINL